MIYENLYSDFKSNFIEDKDCFQNLENEMSVDETDGMHIIFGMVVVQYIIDLFNQNAEKKLRKSFAFLEKMAKSEDILINEVLEFSVLEDFVSRGKDFLIQCIPYMDTETKKSLQAVSAFINIES